MFPPVAAPFAGSFPAEPGATPRLVRLVETAFAALSVLGGATLCVAILFLAGGAGWPAVLKATCAAVLVPALVGLWLRDHVADQAQPAALRIFALVQQRLGSAAPAVGAPGAEPAERGLAGLIAETVLRLRRMQTGRAGLQDAARRNNLALQVARERGSEVARHLRTDLADLSQTASCLMSGSARLVEAVSCTAATAEGAGQDVSAASDRAACLALAVAAVTREITAMTALAVQAAEAAFAAQGSVASLDGKVGALARAAEQVGRALALASRCGRAAGRQAGRSGGSGATGRAGTGEVAVDLSANLLEMAACSEQALAVMQASVAELRAEAGQAGRRVAALSEMIHAQHELGLALGHAVEQQGGDVAELAHMLAQLHTGLATLRQGVGAVTQDGVGRLADAEALRGMVHRLPAHADSIAAILRAIPDFAPPLEF